HSMELIEIEVVGLQAFQRSFQLSAGTSPIAFLRLARKKDVFAMRLERDPEFLLGFAITIGRRNRRIPPEDLTDLIIMLMRSEPSGDVIYNVGGGAIGAAPNHAIRLSSPSP